MEEKDIITLRKYLKRKIAEKNIVFNGMSYKFKEQSKRMRNNIYLTFARGKNSSYDMTTSNLNLKYIREDISIAHKDLSPYNYFDLDTLIAYDKYLEIVIDEIYNSREKRGRSYFVIDDFSSVIERIAPEYLISHAGEKETGFYNINCPIQTLQNSFGKITYERTPDKRAFEKNNSKSECEKLLSKYLKEKHSTQENDIQKKEEEISEPDFYLKNIGFWIENEQNFLDENNYPIKYIVASSQDNKTHVCGFFDISMNVYHGDVYDFEMNIVYDKAQSGAIITGRHSSNKYEGMGK